MVAENDSVRGVSATRNVGVDRARGEVIAFLDDDAVAAPDWVGNMLRVYEEDAVMAVGGDIQPLWQTRQPAWFPDEFGWVVGCGYKGLPDRPTAVRNVIGTNMSFRRTVFDGIGGFDSAIGRVGSVPVGCDETELCVRAHQRWPERKIVHDPGVRVAHRVPARRTSLKYFIGRCYGEGRSKALISERVGQRDALSTEVRYVTHVLPAGVWRGLGDALLGDGSGLGRAAAIITGLTVTSIGFLGARVGGAPAATSLRHLGPPMKVLMVTPRFLPYTGGVELHVAEVARRVAERGHRVTVLSTDPSGELPAAEQWNGVELLRVRAWPRNGGLVLRSRHPRAGSPAAGGTSSTSSPTTRSSPRSRWRPPAPPASRTS